MTSETINILIQFIGAAVAVIAVVVTIVAMVIKLERYLAERFRQVSAECLARNDAVRKELSAEIKTLASELHSRVGNVKEHYVRRVDLDKLEARMSDHFNTLSADIKSIRDCVRGSAK